MLVDFKNNNTRITEIIIDSDDPNNDDYKDSIIIKTDLKIYKITAVGDCCSNSVIKEYKNYKFNNFIGIGKIIEKIEEINIDDDDDDFKDDQDDLEQGYFVSPHLYKMSFKDCDDVFLFKLINYSNGYYDGWIEITEEKQQLIIIIGLPASGKTTYYETYLKNDYKFHDDFISNIYDGSLIKDLKDRTNICITDPRLCNYTRFKNFMDEIYMYLKSNIRLILFKNDLELSLSNSIKRNTNEKKKKEVEKMCRFYSNIYNPSLYE